MNKILFLDFDGVLNYVNCKERYGGPGVYDQGFWGIEPEKVKLLNQVVERTGAKVVISSTWRQLHPLDELRTYLKRQGFTGEVVDRTPTWRDSMYNHRGFRGGEVNEWLEKHPEVEAHAIVDDDGDFHPAQPLVQTSIERGLEEEHVERLVKYLGEINTPV